MQTQEVIDFSADYGIAANIELIRVEQINEAFEQLVKNNFSTGPAGSSS